MKAPVMPRPTKSSHAPPPSAPPSAPSWPADTPERRPVAMLVPSARNARKHSPDQIKHLASLIERFGWTMPVLVDEQGTIIAGHGRVLAALHLKLETVPVIVARGWSPEQRRAYMLADNRAAELSSWDQIALTDELADLGGLGISIEVLGFDGPVAIGTKEARKAGTPGAIEDSPLGATFWIAIKGPLAQQAHAIAALKALAKIDGLDVQSNVLEHPLP